LSSVLHKAVIYTDLAAWVKRPPGALAAVPATKAGAGLANGICAARAAASAGTRIRKPTILMCSMHLREHEGRNDPPLELNASAAGLRIGA
jgi:hypothetical protein